MENDERYLRAKKQVENLKAFYIHLTVYILVNTMLTILNLVTNPSYLWFLFPLVGWGIGLLIHGISFISIGRFGAAWEERKIKEYMDRDR